jgi:phospholipase C
VVASGCQGGASVGAPAPVVGSSSEPGSPGTPHATSSPAGAPVTSPTPTPTPTAISADAACPPPSIPAGVTGPPADSPGNSPFGKIKHIVIVIQENRTFDNIYHGFSEPSGAKADYADYGCDQTGKQIALQSIPYENPYAPSSNNSDFFADYDGGKLDGFYANGATREYASLGNNGLSYLPQVEVQPYWDMATSGALAERFFHGVTGPTYPSHMLYLAGSTTYDNNPAHRVIQDPNQTNAGCDDPNYMTDTVNVLDTDNPNAPPVATCFFGINTIIDELNNAGDTWHYYSFPVTVPGMVAGTAATTYANAGFELNATIDYAQLYGTANYDANNITPSERFLTDVAMGTLEDVTFVTPDNLDSDHPGGQSTAAGPAWVESVVDAVGTSQFYSSTAIFVTWDDWGGFYDHVVPPQKYAPYGLSFRIPLIAISPYARQGQLIDTTLEGASLTRFIEECFALPSLGREDKTANSLDDMFDFAKAPAAFTPIASASKRYPPSAFLHWKPSGLPLDDDMLGPSHADRAPQDVIERSMRSATN